MNKIICCTLLLAVLVCSAAAGPINNEASGDDNKLMSLLNEDSYLDDADQDYNGMSYLVKKSPRRIFIGKRGYSLDDIDMDQDAMQKKNSARRHLFLGKRSGQIHRIFIGKKGAGYKRIFIG